MSDQSTQSDPEPSFVVRLPPPIYFLTALITMGLLHRYTPVARVVTWPWTVAGLLPIFAGSALAIWANVLFQQQHTPVFPGKTPQQLVVSGPFGLTRNPMYLGMMLVLIGIAWGLETLTPWLVLPVFVLLITIRFIRREETLMLARFGDEYNAYKNRVRRWF